MGGGEVEAVGNGGGITAMEFFREGEGDETASYTWPPRIPRRLSRRLHCKTPCTVEKIEAKLRLADLRRQEYYEKLSSKARPKPRSPVRSSSPEEDLGQRLEAKLQAAAQKRSRMLEKAQMRLARLDELRQAAKSGVEMRYQKEREKIGSKVQSRFQQAEANRMMMLKAYRQRRATLKERSSQSLLRKMARDNKYKECVRAAIHQKRVAAEKKRLGFLEAEKKRACARMLQVRRVAKSVSHQREIERRRMKDQLEDRLQRARRQRAEYLRQRGRLHNSVQVNWNTMHKQADLLSRKLARCWKQFLRHRTTLSLAKAYDALNIKEKHVKSMPFEQLALLIESADTLHAVKALLDRFESRLKVLRAIASASHTPGTENIDHLLKRVATPKKRTTPRKTLRGREAKKATTSRETANNLTRLSRYPVRVALCAYMILSHPEAVFSGQGEREIALAKSAEEFVHEFELLLKIVLEGPVHSSDEESESVTPKRSTFRSQLAAFDKAWCCYLNCFVLWKVKDAQLLEEDLVRAACQLELSMMQKCKMTPEGDSSDLTHDLKAIRKQVTEDQHLLREKVHHLSGDAGIERMNSALSETRSKYFLAKEIGSPSRSQITHFISPSPPSSSGGPSFTTSDKKRNMVESKERPSRVVRSLFREDDTPEGPHSSAPIAILDEQLGSSIEKLATENELIVNEFLHKQHEGFTDIFNLNDEDQNGVKAKIRETMENAFWDSIMELMKSEDPNYDRVIQLLKEIRDELCQMAPETWRQMIMEAIDLDVLSQVLKSGNLDVHYLGNILEFALDTLQKLSSPANDVEMKNTHQRLMKELADTCQAKDGSNHSSVIAMIKGLRFVLGQIQVLKREISKARIRIMEPLLKGSAGLDYLKNAFANRYGSPSDAYSSLPLTVQWLSIVWNCKDHEWEEHGHSLSALDNESSSHGLIPSTTLRSGGTFVVKPNMTSVASGATKTAGNQQPECKGERVDLLVRLGLLKLVSGVTGLTQEVLPETFMLNLQRLRAVQAQLQKIIVTAVSILICRQTLVSERIIDSSRDMEGIVSECIERLVELLDVVEDAGIEEIVESISRFSVNSLEDGDVQKLQSRKAVMARMLARSLQAGDPVFEKVSRAVYASARGVVLGGSGPHGRKLAEMALRQVGAAVLSKRLVEAAEVLVVAATVSVSVHGPWYTQLTDTM
ncbi:hypothetical protein L484_016720 [Morus notabilis]|uniref:T-complex protein 11-like protein 1 n=1 Tax=Morus notabilis TaxID=981085 RepID=W9RQ64_9ROSA|nr:uncharacterized protein LOC21399757 isoform X2 [Morus notabilis]EXB87373.1 hypothetical protein L484_016720 [Morus notabilis]